MTRKEKAADRAGKLRTLILSGCTAKQTAALMGIKQNSLYCYIFRLRAQGLDIPGFAERDGIRDQKNKKIRYGSTEIAKRAVLAKYRPENRRYMTDGEIRQSVRLAANPERQIGILADLNNMTKQEVHSIVSDMT